ncbi:MAG: EthD family reductase [Candidatus Binataceae bacterium]
MQINFTSFNFKAGTETAAEERHYFDYHVELAKKLPGLRMYLTGKFIERGGHKPDHYRAAILAFDGAEAAGVAMNSEVGREVRADGAAHLADIRPLALNARIIIPFAVRSGELLLMAAEFDLETGTDSVEVADRRYLEKHTTLARQLPGLRFYATGRLFENRGLEPDRLRCAILAFDSAEALRDAYRAPVGQELRKDEEATIRNARIHRLEAGIEV